MYISQDCASKKRSAVHFVHALEPGRPLIISPCDHLFSTVSFFSGLWRPRKVIHCYSRFAHSNGCVHHLISPLTPDLWPLLQVLFQRRYLTSGEWCGNIMSPSLSWSLALWREAWCVATHLLSLPLSLSSFSHAPEFLFSLLPSLSLSFPPSYSLTSSLLIVFKPYSALLVMSYFILCNRPLSIGGRGGGKGRH